MSAEQEPQDLPIEVEPKETMEEKHKQLALDMFQKITEYLNGELAGMLAKLLWSVADRKFWCAL